MPGSVIYLSPAVKNKTNDIKFGRTATVKAGSSGTTSYVINNKGFENYFTNAAKKNRPYRPVSFWALILFFVAYLR